MISKIFIIISIFATIILNIFPSYIEYGLHNFYLNNKDYINFAIQIISFQFMHGGFMHLLSNSLFIYLFGIKTEEVLGKNKYILLFLITTAITSAGILLLENNSTVTIGISGFTLAILTYYTFGIVKSKQEFKAGLILISINILIGLTSGISLLGHLFGAISGYLFYMYFYFNSRNFKN